MPARSSDVDACPGALRLHPAADGPLARVRLPGGLLTGARLAVLAELADSYGDGHLELTSRANIQLRALNEADPAVLAARLSAAGLLPSETHETVRNIVAPPLADTTMRALVEELDRALCATPSLAALPGRFLFAIGDVPLTADLSARPVPVPPGSDAATAPAEFAVLFAGLDLGLRVPAGRVVPALLTAAGAFLTERSADLASAPAWRLHELPDGPSRVARRTAADLHQRLDGSPAADAPTTAEHGGPSRAAARPGDGSPAGADSTAERVGDCGTAAAAGAGLPMVGVLRQEDGLVAVSALVPLGRLGGEALRLLTTARRLVVTSWRGVIVPDLTPEAARRWVRALGEAGLPVEATSRWVGVTACAGRPGCAKSLADVRADADHTSTYSDGRPVHWVGCARGCGSPSGPHVRVEATPTGYAVTRQPTGETFTGDPASAVAAARRN